MTAAHDWDDPTAARRYSYYDELAEFQPYSSETRTTIQPLAADEMRITFMGSSIPPNLRHAQQMMSIFVEVGWDPDTQLPRDQFVFDCGSGVATNYQNMNVGYGRMDKVFLTHLHADHMSDLTHIYCFGPAADRKSPLYVWGPGPSGVESPAGSGVHYDDGTRAFCTHLREACRWHSESFSFQATGLLAAQPPTRAAWGLPHEPVPVGGDDPTDGYAMIPIELDVLGYDPEHAVAYDNPESGVTITYFPVIHARKGSIGYKLRWRRPDGQVTSMIYTGDTKPESRCVENARGDGEGVDVFIHEMGVPAQVWAMKNTNSTVLPDPKSPQVLLMNTIQNSSHTPQGAFGFLLGQIDPLPRLTVATQFPVSDDTVACALDSVREHVPVYQGPGQDRGRITWSFDLMVISVLPDEIVERRGSVPEIGNVATFQPPPGTRDASGNPLPAAFATPKYHYDGATGGIAGNPYAQIDQSTELPATDADGRTNYRSDGY